MAPSEAQKCLQEGCVRLEEMVDGRSAGGYCAGHRYRKRRGLPMEPPLHEGLARRRPAFDALLDKAIQLGDTPTDESSDPEFRKNVQQLVHAALVYAPTVKSKSSKPALIDTGMSCPHCKLALMVMLPRNTKPDEVAKRARLALLQHVSGAPGMGCSKKAKP